MIQSAVAHRLAWTIRAYNLLRRTTRPRSAYPVGILNAGEAKMMETCYMQGWTPKEFVRVLFLRDKLEQSKCLPLPSKGHI